MWTSFSGGGWMCLLTLAGVMLFWAGEAGSQEIELPCCKRVKRRKIYNTQECFEQKPRYKCNRHAYLIITEEGKKICIAYPPPPWLKKLLKAGELDCPPEISKTRRLKKKKKM